MRYFTPELLLRFRSLDDDVADTAEAAWEQAIKRYRRHWKKISPQLPESVRRFHDEYCLHDADVFGPAKLSVQTLPWGFHDVVLVAQPLNPSFPEHPNTLLFLQYAMAAEPIVEVPVRADAFHLERPTWLYDEFDLIEPGVFVHEILLSDGRVVKLRFRELRFHLATIIEPAEEGRKVPVTGKAVSA